MRLWRTFENNPRAGTAQLEADLESLEVFISMYPVDDHSGERKAASEPAPLPLRH